MPYAGERCQVAEAFTSNQQPYLPAVIDLEASPLVCHAGDDNELQVCHVPHCADLPLCNTYPTILELIDGTVEVCAALLFHPSSGTSCNVLRNTGVASATCFDSLI